MTFLILYDGSGYKMDQKWNYFWFAFSNLHLIVIPVVGLLSANHINKNSKSVERLGIRTNSNLIQLYIVLWISLVLDTVTSGALLLVLNQEQEDFHWQHLDKQVFQIQLSAIILMCMRCIISSCLDLLIMFAYYRLSLRLPSKMSLLVTQCLTSETQSYQSTEKERGEEF